VVSGEELFGLNGMDQPIFKAIFCLLKKQAILSIK
jgi:hypothetical protein